MRARNPADMRQIDDVERRVRRRFEEEHLRVRPDRGFPRIIVRTVDDGRLDPEARQQVIEQPAARTESGARADHVVASGNLAQERSRHRGHAARLRTAGLGPFHQRDTLFKHRDGRVLEARIGHSSRFAGKAIGDGLRIVIGIAAGEEQCLAGLALLATPRAAAHGLRRGAPFGGDGTVHASSLFHSAAR